MLIAIVLAVPDMDQAAQQGANAFYWIMEQVLPRPARLFLLAGIAAAQYFCGLAALTSTSRMAYAFARDGGLPFSGLVRRVDSVSRSPSVAIWSCALLGLAIVWFVPYTTVAAVCVISRLSKGVRPCRLAMPYRKW